MDNNIKTQIGKIIGDTLDSYHSKVKSKIDDLKFRQEYQDRIIECMVGEVDDNYIKTPETNEPIVKLEYSREGLVKVPSIKGKTILVDADGNETNTPGEGCKLISVGEEEDNKLIILSRNYNFELGTFGNSIDVKYSPKSATNRIRTENLIDVNPNNTYIVTCSKGYEISTGMFDKNNICKQNHPRTQMKLIIKPNVDIVKMGIIVRKIDNSDLTVDDILKANIQIEGDLKHHKTEILLNEPLRSLPNGVCDEIVRNQLIRRVGKNADILYELEEPIIEELPNSITLQGFDDTTMYIENSITPTVSYGYNALIPYKQELSNQKEEIEINTLDIENNIIPYLMDMEFNLMLMEDN